MSTEKNQPTLEPINIKASLLEPLKEAYNGAESHKEFAYGLDYMEAMTKFLASLCVSLVGEMDKTTFEEIFLNNFKLTPSLGDFKSLATNCFSKENKKKITQKDSSESFKALYNELYDIFHNTNKITLDTIDSLMSNKNSTVTKTSLSSLLNEYIVTFRNKLKGHGASYRDDESEQIEAINNTLRKINDYIEKSVEAVVSLGSLSFSVEKTSSEITHDINSIYVSYSTGETTDTFKIIPIMVYLTCDKYSCKDNHRIKIFYYNDGTGANSYYLDYGYNHYFCFEKNDIKNVFEELTKLESAVLGSSSEERRGELVGNFVGREDELKIAKEYLLNSIKINQSSSIVIIGSPGIGKSAFISKLQTQLKEDSEQLNKDKSVIDSYIFYAKKGDMGNEVALFYSKIRSFFKEQLKLMPLSGRNDKNADSNIDEDLAMQEKLEKLFKSYSYEKETRNLVIFIDGLDEFDKPVDFLGYLPIQANKNIHIVFSTRQSADILAVLKTKLYESHVLGDSKSKEVFKDEKIQDYANNSYSLEIGALTDAEAKSLISDVLPYEIKQSEEYEEILNEICDRSEKLPLYIKYICDELKRKNPQSDFAKEILEYAKQLPPKLSEFYIRSFKNIQSKSREILNTLYSSKTQISFNLFFKLLQSNGIDATEFKQKYFNEIAIFLTSGKNGYGFYHLSVKEALKSYYTNEKDIKCIAELDVKTFLNEFNIPTEYQYLYDALKEELFYIEKTDHGFFASLQNLYQQLDAIKSDDAQNDELLKYYKNNYLHIAYSYIWFRIFQDTIDFESFSEKKYVSLANIQMSNEVQQSIESLFRHYEKIKPFNLEDIRYAIEIALLSKNYEQLLKITDHFGNNIQDRITAICSSNYKPDTNTNVKVIQKENFDDYQAIKYDVFASLEDEFLVSLANSDSVIRDNPDIARDIASELIELLNFDSIEYTFEKLLDYRKSNSESITVLTKDLQDGFDEADRWVEIVKKCLEKSSDSNVNFIKDNFNGFCINALRIANIAVTSGNVDHSEYLNDTKKAIQKVAFILISTSVIDNLSNCCQASSSDEKSSLIYKRVFEILVKSECNVEYMGQRSLYGYEQSDSYENLIFYFRKFFQFKGIADTKQSNKDNEIFLLIEERLSRECDSDDLELMFEWSNHIINSELRFRTISLIVKKSENIEFIRSIILSLDQYDPWYDIYMTMIKLSVKNIIFFDALAEFHIQNQFLSAFIEIYEVVLKGSDRLKSEIFSLLESEKNPNFQTDKSTFAYYLTGDIEFALCVDNPNYKNIILLNIAKRFDDLEKIVKIWERMDNPNFKNMLIGDSLTKCRDIDEIHRYKRYLDNPNFIDKYYNNAVYQLALRTRDIALMDLINNQELRGNGYIKIKLLMIVDLAMTNLEQALHNLDEIQDLSKKQKFKTLIELAERLSHSDVGKALDVIAKIQDSSYKSIALSNIIDKINDEGTFNTVLIEILALNNNTTNSIGVILNNAKRYDITNLLLNNIMIQRQICNNFTSKFAYDFVSHVDKKSLIRYYGLPLEKKSHLELMVEELVELKKQREQAENDENESLYDEITERAEEIKNKIYEKNKELEVFLAQYNVTELKYKRTDILELI